VYLAPIERTTRRISDTSFPSLCCGAHHSFSERDQESRRTSRAHISAYRAKGMRVIQSCDYKKSLVRAGARPGKLLGAGLLPAGQHGGQLCPGDQSGRGSERRDEQREPDRSGGGRRREDAVKPNASAASPPERCAARHRRHRGRPKPDVGRLLARRGANSSSTLSWNADGAPWMPPGRRRRQTPRRGRAEPRAGSRPTVAARPTMITTR